MRLLKSTFSFILITNILLTGCAATAIMDKASEEELANIETSNVFQSDYDSIWAAIIRMTALNGVVVLNQDKDSGLITTDWVVEKAPIGLFQAGERYRGNMFVEKVSPEETKVSIAASFERSIGDNASWLNVTRPKRHATLEQDVFHMIEENLD